MTEAPEPTEPGNRRRAARAAAQWWTDQLTDHAPAPSAARDADLLVAGLADAVRANAPRPTPGQLAAFTLVLAEAIEHELARIPWVSVGTDYQPDLILRGAAERAGLSWELLPLKTIMHVRSDEISVTPCGPASPVGTRGRIWPPDPEPWAPGCPAPDAQTMEQ